MLTKKITVYAVSGWGFCSSIFNSLNNDELNIVGLNYLQAPENSLKSIAQYLTTELPDQAVLLGWSFGGLIAIELATLFPEKIKKLILLSSQPRLLSDNDWVGIDPSQANNFKLALMQSDQPMQQFIRLVSYPSRSSMLRKTLSSFLFKQSIEKLISLLTVLFEADLREQYRSLNVDILHIINDQDAVITQSVTQIKKLKPDANVIEFKNLGHAGFLSACNEYSDAIRDFLKNECNYSTQD